MDLSTRYLGLDLPHPIVASASPMSRNLDGVRRLEDAGAAAIVLQSLYEEDVRAGSARVDDHLRLVRDAVESCDVPIIASLNGATPAGWTEHARLLASAKPAAMELNLYHVPASIEETSTEVEERFFHIVASVRRAERLPLAVKLSPYFSSPGAAARRFVELGAGGLVLFNRFYQPDIDLDRMAVSPSLDLSTPTEIRLPLLWIGVLAGRLDVDLAATTGVDSHREVAKYIAAGANAVMTTSALLRYGPRHIQTLVDGLDAWMMDQGIGSLDALRGRLSHRTVSDPAAYERANYLRILDNRT